jgi:hypothetical protein
LNINLSTTMVLYFLSLVLRQCAAAGAGGWAHQLGRRVVQIQMSFGRLLIGESKRLKQRILKKKLKENKPPVMIGPLLLKKINRHRSNSTGWPTAWQHQ